MKKYDITITQKELYSFEIKAENEQEAENKAFELFENDRNSYFFDSENDVEVTEIKEE